MVVVWSTTEIESWGWNHKNLSQATRAIENMVVTQSDIQVKEKED